MRVLLICNYKPGVGGISGQVEILHRYLREEGHIAEMFSTKGSFLWRLGLLCRLRKVAKDYDVLHIHCCSGWGFLPAVVGVIVGRKLGKRVVLTYHGGGGERFFARHTSLVRHYLLRTDANIVLSGFLGEVFDKHRLPYTIIPHILEFDDSHYHERKEIKPHFICTRAHEPLYNIPCLLRAFQKVLAELPEASLTLVGDGSQHDALIAMSDDMGLKNVTFTGRVDNSDIYKYLDEADILLSSPTIDNMPVSLLEAMNAGLLVISSNVGGVPYMVEDSKTGFLFTNDDSECLARIMIQAVNQSAMSLSIIASAKHAVNAYRWENIRQQLYTAYGLPA